jgi:hypothetical protein
MQCLKQRFSVRFNLHRVISGHVWGDRYWSRVLEGEPPEGAGDVVAAGTGEISFGRCPVDGVSPLTAENPAEPRFSPQTPAPTRLSRRTRPVAARNHQHKPPPKGHQATAPREVCSILNPSGFPKKTNADALAPLRHYSNSGRTPGGDSVTAGRIPPARIFGCNGNSVVCPTAVQMKQTREMAYIRTHKVFKFCQYGTQLVFKPHCANIERSMFPELPDTLRQFFKII